jgi:hypothetical protein
MVQHAVQETLRGDAVGELRFIRVLAQRVTTLRW